MIVYTEQHCFCVGQCRFWKRVLSVVLYRAHMAPPLAGPIPSGLLPQQTLSGAGTRATYTGAPAGGLGAPLQSFPASVGGISTASGRAGAGQRRAAAGGATTGRVCSTAGAGGTGAKVGAGKKALANSKAKQNSRFQTAVPHGVDIMEHDLRGYVIECAQPTPSMAAPCCG